MVNKMIESVTVTFTRDQWLPTTRDGLDYELHYNFVLSRFIGKPDEVYETKSGLAHVGISGTLRAMWKLERESHRESLRRILFEYAQRHVREKAEEGALGDRFEIQLTSYTAPSSCPFDPTRVRIIFDEPVEFRVPSKNPMAVAEPASLPFYIIDLRDSINALFGESFGERLLNLPQEQHIIELFKRCDDHESFAYRAASIGGLATAIEPKGIRKAIKAASSKACSSHSSQAEEPAKPIELLGKFLRMHFQGNRVNPIMDVIKNFNNLRRMYPIHTDRAHGVLSAHRFFAIDYPVQDPVAAGTRLLEAYRDMLERLLELLKNN